MLLFNSERFLQTLEGPETIVKILLDKSSKDPLHEELVVVSQRTMASRQFGAWAMAFDDGQGNPALRERTDAMLAEAAPETRAMFNRADMERSRLQ